MVKGKNIKSTMLEFPECSLWARGGSQKGSEVMSVVCYLISSILYKENGREDIPLHFFYIWVRDFVEK